MRGDAARRLAFDVLRQINGEGAYANLALAQALGRSRLDSRDAAFVTELVAGTCRMQGTYDQIIELAAGRALSSLQPAVVDLLRLGTHQALSMRMPDRAAVAATVDLARASVGQRVTGLVNAVLRKVARRELTTWQDELIAAGLSELSARTHHPQWVVDAYVDLLGEEAQEALAANNTAPRPTLVVRPGLAEVADLTGAIPTSYSPFGASYEGNPANIPAVAEGRAGVQDEGSQLVAWALTRVAGPKGPWLDLCAGPGGKSALLAGMAPGLLLAAEAQPHRAELVANALRAYGPQRDLQVVAADGTRPAWGRSFARVLADVPCTGLGALRRRPEARWRRLASDVDDLHPLQVALLHSAIDSTIEGGVVAYVTCSPHRLETAAVVEEVLAARSGVSLLRASEYLPEVPDAALGAFVQLWPHKHGTDAMFLALMRVDSLGA